MPDKNKAFAEIYRVLKLNGSFWVSEGLVKGDLHERIRKDAEIYAGCLSGAIEPDDYIDRINKNGFRNITIHKQKGIEIKEEVLLNYLRNKKLPIKKTTVQGYSAILFQDKNYKKHYFIFKLFIKFWIMN